jgi:hypothetical protein
MGTIGETRKLVQDFLAPELREIKARLEALEAKTKTRFDAVQVQCTSLKDGMKSRFDAQDKVMAAQHTVVMSALSNLTNYAALAERLSKLKNERGQQAH